MSAREEWKLASDSGLPRRVLQFGELFLLAGRAMVCIVCGSSMARLWNVPNPATVEWKERSTAQGSCVHLRQFTTRGNADSTGASVAKYVFCEFDVLVSYSYHVYVIAPCCQVK